MFNFSCKQCCTITPRKLATESSSFISSSGRNITKVSRKEYKSLKIISNIAKSGEKEKTSMCGYKQKEKNIDILKEELEKKKQEDEDRPYDGVATLPRYIVFHNLDPGLKASPKRCKFQRMKTPSRFKKPLISRLRRKNQTKVIANFGLGFLKEEDNESSGFEASEDEEMEENPDTENRYVKTLPNLDQTINNEYQNQIELLKSSRRDRDKKILRVSTADQSSVDRFSDLHTRGFATPVINRALRSKRSKRTNEHDIIESISSFDINKRAFESKLNKSQVLETSEHRIRRRMKRNRRDIRSDFFLKYPNKFVKKFYSRKNSEKLMTGMLKKRSFVTERKAKRTFFFNKQKGLQDGNVGEDEGAEKEDASSYQSKPNQRSEEHQEAGHSDQD